MARRAGSLALETTDYSDTRLFPPGSLTVPRPFVRIEDFEFTPHGTLLPPTSAMLDLIDPARRSDAPSTMTFDRTAILEIELTRCTTARPLANGDPAGPRLRMAVLWGRLGNVTVDPVQSQRAAANESELYGDALRALLLERDANFSSFGFHYGWSVTAILEGFAEALGFREVAAQAWEHAAAVHDRVAHESASRKESRAHRQMATIDRAHVAAIHSSSRQLLGRGGQAVNLQGHGHVATSSEHPSARQSK